MPVAIFPKFSYIRSGWVNIYQGHEPGRVRDHRWPKPIGGVGEVLYRIKITLKEPKP